VTNRFPATCSHCGGKVWPGEGEVRREESGWIVTHEECARARARQAEEAARIARIEAMKDDDDRAAEAWDDHLREAIRLAFREATHVGTRQDGACYYDFSTYRMTIDLPGVDRRLIWDVLSDRDGHSMAAYGAAGGYTTQGDVTEEAPGLWLVERVYHHGD
jgi:hypothetical protein